MTYPSIFSKLATLCATGAIFALVLIMIATKASSKQIRYIKAHGGKRYVYLKDVAGYYGMKHFIWKKKCGLYSRYSRIEFTYEKKEGMVNGIKTNFLHAPFLKGYDAFISEQDFLLLLDPIIRNKTLRPHRMRVVLIDPGHGGRDVGGRGRFYLEKKIALKIAIKLRDILRKKGYMAIMTRDGDKFIPLEKRALETAKKHADIFVSIHANIAGKPHVSGIETFCVTPAGAASTHDSKPKFKREKGNALDKNNARLAHEIHQALIIRTKANDRGIKRARFVVVKNASCPAVLLETGFLSNSREERALGRDSYQKILAHAIAEGIVKYHKALRKK